MAQLADCRAPSTAHTPGCIQLCTSLARQPWASGQTHPGLSFLLSKQGSKLALRIRITVGVAGLCAFCRSGQSSRLAPGQVGCLGGKKRTGPVAWPGEAETAVQGDKGASCLGPGSLLLSLSLPLSLSHGEAGSSVARRRRNPVISSHSPRWDVGLHCPCLCLWGKCDPERGWGL